MKIKTSGLTGAALDWAVQMAEGYIQPDPIGFAQNCFKPSTNWSQGGPIVEREEIGVEVIEGALYMGRKVWEARHPSSQVVTHGPTPLIAGMRCYVASKLGDEVDVPEELL
jgi:hypothetical protein